MDFRNLFQDPVNRKILKLLRFVVQFVKKCVARIKLIAHFGAVFQTIHFILEGSVNFEDTYFLPSFNLRAIAHLTIVNLIRLMFYVQLHNLCLIRKVATTMCYDLHEFVHLSSKPHGYNYSLKAEIAISVPTRKPGINQN